MVRREHHHLTADVVPSGEATSGDGDDLAVEPVEALPGAKPRDGPLPPALRVERLRRLALQLRVVTLEDELDRERRRREQLIERYEQVIADEKRREAEESTPTFSWLPRR